VARALERGLPVSIGRHVHRVAYKASGHAHQSERRTSSDVPSTGCLAVAWGANWPINKIGLRDLPPFTYGSARVAIGMVAIVGVPIAKRGLRRPDRRDIPVVSLA